MAYYKCSGLTPTGNATAGDVLSGKTFSNESGTDKTGTMPDNGAVSAALDTGTTSYTIPAGYHNGSGSVSISTQTKSVGPSTSAQTVTPDSGKVLSSVSVSAMALQAKSASPSTGAQTIYADSGYHGLSSVSIAAISPQRSAPWATASGQDSSSPYVYFPYGWYSELNGYGHYCRMSAAQAVAACPSQGKTTAPTSRSASAATVYPDSGKLLSSVTVNTNSVPNTNSGTYTFGRDYNTVDLGAENTYRYVNPWNVFSYGYDTGYPQGYSAGYADHNPANTVTYGVPVLDYVIGGRGTVSHIDVDSSRSYIFIYGTYGKFVSCNVGTELYNNSSNAVSFVVYLIPSGTTRISLESSSTLSFPQHSYALIY